jgi:hypothetical protein
MVRRGSTVRVRQRALRKSRKDRDLEEALVGLVARKRRSVDAQPAGETPSSDPCDSLLWQIESAASRSGCSSSVAFHLRKEVVHHLAQLFLEALVVDAPRGLRMGSAISPIRRLMDQRQAWDMANETASRALDLRPSR